MNAKDQAAAIVRRCAASIDESTTVAAFMRQVKVVAGGLGVAIDREHLTRVVAHALAERRRGPGVPR